MSVFCDTSALVTRYADEPGARSVRALAMLVVSCLSRVEVVAALWRKVRTGELSAGDAGLLATAYERDAAAGDFVTVGLTDATLDLATRYPPRYRLRAYDAVQLATAVTVRAVEPTCRRFACADGDLAAAATAEGFDVLVPG